MTDWDDRPPTTPPTSADLPPAPRRRTRRPGAPPTRDAPTPPLGTSIPAAVTSQRPPPPVADRPAGSGGHGRDLLAAALAVLAVVALFGANVSWWISHDVYDTPRSPPRPARWRPRPIPRRR